MNLSEKLNLDYCDTSILQYELDDHKQRCEKYITNPPYEGFIPNIWQTIDSPFYKVMELIKTKQERHEVVTDDEYRSLPICGLPNYWSVANYYFNINFHYNFHHLSLKTKDELVDKLLNFLAVIDFSHCKESEILNWRNTIEFGLRCYYGFDFNAHFDEKLNRAIDNVQDKVAWQNEHFSKKENFVLDILDAVNPLNKNNIECLNTIDRNIAPAVFDNAVIYFKIKENHFYALEDEYHDYTSLKAKDVMRILSITRPTLCKYVKENRIKTDSNINGKYTYNKQSVFDLLENHMYGSKK